MAKHHEEITPPLEKFIGKQKMFFVATAGPKGRVNLSPKGMDGILTILDSKRVAFLNVTGSGNETAAHLRLNDRITMMFCAFEGPPMILRLYGRGRMFHAGDAEWAQLLPRFGDLPGKRQIVEVAVEDVVTSCGYAVPLMDFREQRDTLVNWTKARGEAGIRDYWKEVNLVSMDGDPTGLPVSG